MRQLTLFTLGLFLSMNALAVRVFIDHQSFYNSETGPYLEVVFSFEGKSMKSVKTSGGQYMAQAKCNVFISQGTQVFQFAKFNANSTPSLLPKATDFMSVERFPLADGTYEMTVEVADANDSLSAPLVHTEKIEISHLSEGCFFSDIAFISAFTNTVQENAFSKAGYDLIPYVSNYYPTSLDGLILYAELYNSRKLLGKKVSFAYALCITDALQNEIPNSKRIIRAEADDVLPLLQTLDISNLTTGEYKVKLEMLDREGKVVCTQFRNFTRNKILEDTYTPPSSQDLSNTFVAKYTNSDSLYAHIRSCLPIAESVERNTIDNVLKNLDLKTRQSFMYTFWYRRNSTNPEKAWNDYYKDVLAVQKEFGTRIKEGWQTDRGRVYLQYGKPSTRIVRNNDPDYWPFEIWHYYTTNTGLRDRRFLFYNTSLNYDMELLHSDIPNEVRNFDWKNLVRSRQMSDPTSTGRIGNNQDRDPYSGDELEDLWYNPH
jgi:GWxTD domain-containing protein